MGRKLFVLILQGLGEDTEDLPFIDGLNVLFSQSLNLTKIWLSVKDYTEKRFDLLTH
jgi:hypothetical protein